MKRLSFLAIVLFFVVFGSLTFAQTQSDFWTTKVGDAGYNLNTNSGERSMTVEVNFPKPYDIKPKVMVSVTLLDADKDVNTRYNVEVLSVSRDGFTIKIRTWADSKIFSIGGYWLSYTE